MGFHVFNTYVKVKDGHTKYFDAITDNNNIEKQFLLQKNG